MITRLLSSVGRKLFPFRLVIGLVVTAVAFGWIWPTPLFSQGYWPLHTFGLLGIFTGVGMRAWGSGSAGSHTRSEIIEAPKLTTGGAFAHVRNPIYAGTVSIGIGMSLLIGDPKALFFAAVALGILYFALVPAEEEFLSERFGEEYASYRAEVPRLIPRLTPWPHRSTSRFHWPALQGELAILLLLCFIYGALVAKASLV